MIMIKDVSHEKELLKGFPLLTRNEEGFRGSRSSMKFKRLQGQRINKLSYIYSHVMAVYLLHILDLVLWRVNDRC